MALSALGFSTMSVLVKLACRTLPTGEVVLARAVITLVLSFVMVRRAGLSPFGMQRGKLVVRGLLGFAALSCYYMSLARLQLAEATTLQNMIPVFTALLAWWILGERVGGGAAIAIACGVVGVVLVAHPTAAGADPIGVTCALVGATFSAFAYVTVRQLARTEHPLVIVFYFPLVATPLAIPWAAYDWVWPDARGWLLLLAIGVATQVGQVFLTMALAIERAGRATSVGYLQICFAIIWQLVVFGVWPSWSMLAGASLIIAGTLAVSATAAAAPQPHTPTSPAP
jgi:drug/metabolite transporter (DMT)-like permease